MSTFRAANTICELKNWQVSNLPLQKLLYLSHLIHLGTQGVPLASNQFEAWDLGPVEPQLYRKLKAYGSRNVPDIFGVDAYPDGSPERQSIEMVLNDVGNATPGKLVAITHWPQGAWALHYRPNTMGIKIPDADIAAEYRKIIARSGSGSGSGK